MMPARYPPGNHFAVQHGVTDRAFKRCGGAPLAKKSPRAIKSWPRRKTCTGLPCNCTSYAENASRRERASTIPSVGFEWVMHPTLFRKPMRAGANLSRGRASPIIGTAVHNACRGTEQTARTAVAPDGCCAKSATRGVAWSWCTLLRCGGFVKLALKITPSFERLQATLQQGMNRRAGCRILALCQEAWRRYHRAGRRRSKPAGTIRAKQVSFIFPGLSRRPPALLQRYNEQ